MADVVLELADGLKKRLALNISDRAADFNNGNLCFIAGVIAVETVLNLICNMRDDLNRAAAVIAAPFFVKDGPVNLSSRDIGIFVQTLVNKTFIMSKIKICLCAVVRDKHLSVLNRIHGTRVDIDIGVKFLHGYFVTSCLQQPSKRCRRDSFAETGNNAAGHKYVFYWHNFSSKKRIQKTARPPLAWCLLYVCSGFIISKIKQWGYYTPVWVEMLYFFDRKRKII